MTDDELREVCVKIIHAEWERADALGQMIYDRVKGRDISVQTLAVACGMMLAHAMRKVPDELFFDIAMQTGNLVGFSTFASRQGMDGDDAGS